LGGKIASGNLSLVCNPHIPGHPGSRLFDGEGIVCAPVPIIKEGILQNFLYNLESANRENRPSTGHAARSYSGQVGTSFSNFLVEKGDHSLAELLNIHPRCLYVTNLEGASGCSPVSGEISIGVQGQLVANGKIIAPVDAVTISSNYFDMINRIQAISNQYSDMLSSVKVPDVLIESMHVAGS
jgi:PmbA protein